MGILTLLVVAWLSGSYLYPDYFSLNIIEVTETTSEKIPVYEVEKSYRSFDISLNAFKQKVSFSAGPIAPHILPLTFFWLIQWIAWAFLLATSSKISSRWAFLFYILAALFLYFTDIPDVLFTERDIFYRSLGFLLMVVPLVLAWAFQMEIIKASFNLRFFAFLFLLGIYFAIPLSTGGEIAMHQLSVNAFPFLVAFSILSIWLGSKDPTNLIFALSTNRPDKKGRLGFRWIVVLLVLFFVIEFFWLHEFLNFNWFPEVKLAFRPTHLLIIVLLLTVFTSQNHFHQFQEALSAQSNYTFIIQSVVLITASFLALGYSSGDPLFVFAIERLLAVVFLATGLAHAVFVIFNHLPLLKNKINLYYLMTQGPRFGIWVVTLCGLLGMIFAEGYENWKSWDLFQHSYYNHAGDQKLMEGDRERAVTAYNLARAKVQNSTKANYNLASLVLANPLKVADAARYYLQATRLYEFPPARMNAASLFQVNGQADVAKSVLKEGLTSEQKNSWIANNLALIYVQENQVDSAILMLKDALLSDPSLSSVHSNLALIYMDNDLPDQAKTFLGFALEESPDMDADLPQAARVNALVFDMKNKGASLLQDESTPPSSQFFLAYNHQLKQFSQHPNKLNTKLIKQLVDDSQMQSPEILLLDGLHMFNQDSIIHAVSRLQYLASTYQAYAKEANYLLGVSFYEKGVPEMARKYFLESGNAGNPWGYLHAAQMEIELHMPDTADSRLSLIRVQYDTLWNEASKERAMLLRPYVKDDVYVQTMYDLNSLSFKENIRMGLYADSLNQYITALSSFRRAQQQDSASIVPYLELARIYNKYRDSLAIENLEAGLNLVDSSNIALKTELARAYLYNDRSVLTSSLIDEVKSSGEMTREILRLEAEKAQYAGDSVQAIVLWDSLRREYPMDQEAILALCQLFEAGKKYELGNAVITQALEYNTENAEFWYFYAIFSRAWNLSEDAGNGAMKAIELAYDPERKRQIRQEFAREIELVTTN